MTNVTAWSAGPDLGPRQRKALEKATSDLRWTAKTVTEINDSGEHDVTSMFGTGPNERPEVKARMATAEERIEAIRLKYDSTVTGQNVREIIADLQLEAAALRATRPRIDTRPTPEEREERKRNLDASMEQSRRDADARAEAEQAWAALMARGPKGTAAIIVAELEEDQSDMMTDYFASKTTRRVAIGYRTGSREDFRQLRRAAATFGPTAHLGPDCGRFRVMAVWQRADPSTGRYQGSYAPNMGEPHGETFARRSEAEAAIATREAAEALPEGIAWEVVEESIEHRDNYSMGRGNWLGTDLHSGWQVRSMTGCPGIFEDAITRPQPPIDVAEQTRRRFALAEVPPPPPMVTLEAPEDKTAPVTSQNPGRLITLTFTMEELGMLDEALSQDIDDHAESDPDADLDDARRLLFKLNAAREGSTAPFQVIPGTRAGFVEIRFPDKPEAALREELKQAGYRWSARSACWYGPKAALPSRYVGQEVTQ